MQFCPLITACMIDTYVFAGQAGQAVTIRLESAEFDTVLILRDSEEKVLGSNDDLATGNNNSLLTVTLPSNGTYQILAYAYDPEERGSYSLSVISASEAEIQRGEAFRLLQQGEQQYYASQFREALQSFETALTIYQDSDVRTTFSQESRAMEAIALKNIGAVYRSIGQLRRALGYFSQALPIFREVGDRTQESRTLGGIGVIYDSIGQPQQALEYFNQALLISQDVGDRRGEAATLTGIAVVYNNFGQPQRALEYYSQALPISQEVGDRAGEASILSNIGAVYRSIGQPQGALEYLNQALAISQDVGDRAREASILSGIGLISNSIGQPQGALEYLNQALAINQEVGARVEEAIALNNIGLVYYSIGQPQQALEYYNQALPILQEVGDRTKEAVALNNIGVSYRSIGQPQQALEYYGRALLISQDVGYRVGEVITLSNAGSAYEDQDKFTEAIKYYQRSINVTESIQGEIQLEGLKSSFASTHIDTYARLTNLLIEQGEFVEAFNYTERGKARAFLDQMASGQVDFRAGVDYQLLQQEQDLSNQIITLQRQLIALNNRPQDERNYDAIDEATNQLSALQREYANLLTQIKLQSPATASLVAVDVAPLEEIQSLLEPDTTLVEYFVTDDRTFAFIITRTSFDTVTLNISREDLVDAITLLRDFADLSDEIPPELQQLHQILIEPLQEYLTTSQLVIVPHDILHYLPFAALTDGGRYLSDRYTLSLLPSANVLRFLPLSHPSQTNALMAFGDPITPVALSGLSSAQTEVEAIARLFNTTSFINSEATESRVRSQAPTANILHLAVHGEYNPINPLFSTLYLTADDQNDGRLEVHEIYGLDLTQQTNLVVLSACQTNIGEQSRGDEIVGLNRAFLYAGTPAVMSSLWDVDDAATALLMEQFYTHLQMGSDSATALQRAQQAVRQNPEFAHPYYWSAFSITGRGGQ